MLEIQSDEVNLQNIHNGFDKELKEDYVDPHDAFRKLFSRCINLP